MKGERETGFLCDVMLGRLSRWLRLLGYDTEYFRDGEDAFLAERTVMSGRILLTRDNALHRRLPRRSILVSFDRVDEQLRQLRDAGRIEFRRLRPSRCPVCNGPLRGVEPAEVDGKVPRHVIQRHADFTACEGCGRVYWGGSHLRGILERLSSAVGR